MILVGVVLELSKVFRVPLVLLVPLALLGLLGLKDFKVHRVLEEILD